MKRTAKSTASCIVAFAAVVFAAVTFAAAVFADEAKFIGFGPEAGRSPCYVRREVVNEKSVSKAQWRVAGLGVFVPCVNVKPVYSVPDEVLMPGYTHFTKRRHEIALDVTDCWDKADGATNALSALVSPSWWCDAIAGKNGGTWPAFRGMLDLTFDDGTTATIPTDETWDVTTNTFLVSSGIWEGEVVDARKMKLDEREPPKAKVNREFNGEISERIGPAIVMRRDLLLCDHYEDGKPIPFCRMLKPGETNVIDFGQNCAAIPYIQVSAERGTKVTIKLAEMLNDGIAGHHGDGPKGSVYMANMRGASSTLVYTCRDAKVDTVANHESQSTTGQPSNHQTIKPSNYMESYHPLTTFYGYRYAAVSADKPLLYAICSMPVSSVSKEMEHGWVETGRGDVNRLVKNAYWGMLSNYLSIPTDCPQRTERYGWTADTQVFSKTGAYFADTASFMRKWMQDVRDSQEKDGTIPLVCPIGSWDAKGPKAGWSDAAIIVPWTMWKYLGDEEIVRENWDAMVKYIKAIDAHDFTSKRGEWLLCDWLSFEKLTVDNRTKWSNGGYTDDHLEYQNFLNACFLYQDALMMAEMAHLVPRASCLVPRDSCLVPRGSCIVPRDSRNGDYSEFEVIAARTRERILKTWFKDDGTLIALFDGMQTPALYALKLKLGDRTKIAASLVAAIHANGDRLATGFLGTPLICDVLSEIGETELAYTLLLQHDFPSWLYSVDQGATTVWERWDGYTRENGFGPVSMNSFNHYSYGAVVGWLFEHAAGIKPDEAGGWKNFTIRPEPDERLGRINAKLGTPFGEIVSAWQCGDQGKISYRIVVPQGATATLILPGESPRILEPGEYTF